MYSPEDRERIRSEILAVASRDARITGGAVTGSAALDNEDRWSDIDLGFGVGDSALIGEVLADWTDRMYREHDAQHHMDVTTGAWIYRVFLLRSTLQVDLAFAPATEFGARAPSFRLKFGTAADRPHLPLPTAESLIGYAWLYSLHVRSSIARGRLWQAEYMLSAVRDHVLALACLRHGLSPREGRGMDRLPEEVTRPLEFALVQRLEPDELRRAFRAALDGLATEVGLVDTALLDRLEPVLRELLATSRG